MRFALLAACLVFVTASADADPPKQPGNPKGSKTPAGPLLPKIEERIPVDASPELRALLKQNVDTLRSTTAKTAERVRAAGVLGELGEKGRPASRFLCEAM